MMLKNVSILKMLFAYNGDSKKFTIISSLKRVNELKNNVTI